MEAIDRVLLKRTFRASVATFLLGCLVLYKLKVPWWLWISAVGAVPAALIWTRVVSCIFEWVCEKSFAWRMSQEVKIDE